MASGGAGGGGASSSSSSSSSSRSKSSRPYISPGVALSKVYAKSRALGDLKLAQRTDPTSYDGVYTYCGHGAVHLYEDDRVGEWIRRPIVPIDCAYITTAELGCGTSSADSGDKIYRTIWFEEDEGMEIVLLNCRRRDEKGIDSIRMIEKWFRDPEEERTTAIIRREREPFADSYVLPCFMSRDDSEDAVPGVKVYAFPSGIQACGAGVDLNAGMEVVGDVVTKEILEFMYKGSVFPTVDQVLGTMGMAEILLQDPSPGVPAKPNRRAVIKCIYTEWTCTSMALLLSFPGVHVNTLCAFAPFEATRGLLGPPASRKASEEGEVRRLAQLSERELDALELPVLLRTGEFDSLPWGKLDSMGEKNPKKPPSGDPRLWTPSDRSWAIDQLLKLQTQRVGLEGAVLCKPASKAASSSCTIARRNSTRHKRTTRTTNRRRRSKSKTRRNR